MNKVLKFCTFAVKTPPRCPHSLDGGGILANFTSEETIWPPSEVVFGKVQNFSKMIRFAPLFALVLAIIFNLWLFRVELTIKSDPNDNIFQFALVNRANIVWEKTRELCPRNLSFVICHLSFLIDHWVPEWAEGYPLPFYYSHLPQIAIVASYHLINWVIGLFTYYHILTYLTLSFFPLSVFWAVRVMGFSPLVQTFAALFATHISTDGLYGMDNSSYIWRGYGLSSQLFAWFFMPLAVAYAFKAAREITNDQDTRNKQLLRFNNQNTNRNVLRFGHWNLFRNWKLEIGNSPKAIIALVATFSSHLGLGYIALLSLFPLLFITFKAKEIIARGKRLILIVAITIGLLSYWIVPFWLNKAFHNISVWDPMWKFNSFGYFDVLVRFFEGELIDFGRFPILTILTLVGFFVLWLNGNRTKKTLKTNQKLKNHSSFIIHHCAFPIALLLPLWLLLFFGRTTWGLLVNLLPGAESFHLHRFINGLHLSVLFLAPVGAAWMVNKVSIATTAILKIVEAKWPSFKGKDTAALPQSLLFVIWVLSFAILLIPTYRQTISYAKPNGDWLASANTRFDSDWPDFNRLITALGKLPPGRIYAGKPGYWGKDFRIGDTQMYMALSVRGFEISQFLPETWSPNSDTEQFFDERVKHHFDLYNLRYVVAPEGIEFPEFVRLREKFGKFLLYQVDTSGYFTVAKSNLAVLANRTNYHNLVHLWQISPQVKQKLFPVLAFKSNKLPTAINAITLVDPTTYVWRGDKKEKSIFAESPIGFPVNYATPSAIFSNEQVEAGQRYTTFVSVSSSCTDCFIVFKATFHPNWQIFVDGKKAEKMIVFPFFIGIPISPGDHTVIATYEPSALKLVLLGLSAVGIVGWFARKRLAKIGITYPYRLLYHQKRKKRNS